MALVLHPFPPKDGGENNEGQHLLSVCSVQGKLLSVLHITISFIPYSKPEVGIDIIIME